MDWPSSLVGLMLLIEQFALQIRPYNSKRFSVLNLNRPWTVCSQPLHYLNRQVINPHWNGFLQCLLNHRGFTASIFRKHNKHTATLGRIIQPSQLSSSCLAWLQYHRHNSLAEWWLFRVNMALRCFEYRELPVHYLELKCTKQSTLRHTTLLG